ncbi:protein eyes shut homolog [Pogona vitticeps]
MLYPFFFTIPTGWEGFHCEEDINECASDPCTHGICIQNEPGLGYTCYCEPGFVGQHCELNYDDCLIRTCPAGFLCVDGINNITCLPAVPQRGHIITKTEGSALTELLHRGLTQPQSSFLTPDISASQTSAGLQKTDFPRHGILATSTMSKLLPSIWFESFGLGSLTTDCESSAASSLTSTAAVPTSQLLGYVGLFSTRTELSIIAASHSATESSGDVTLVLLSQEDYDMTSFITESLMTIPVSSVPCLSVGNHMTLALSATDFSSVISHIPETKIELNSHSLFSPRFQPTTLAIACSVLSRLPQENTRQQSAVPLVSISGDRMFPNPLVTFVFPSEGNSFERGGCFSSSVVLDSKRQTSLQDGYLDISVLSFYQELTDLSLQSASSLCKLKQTYVRGSSADIKLSGESSDQVLHSKESPLYQAFWMNLMILTSWYTLMKSTADTSGHLFISVWETAPTVQHTEVSSLYPAERSKGTFRVEDHILTTPLQELDIDISSVRLDRAASVLSPTICLEPSFSTITASQRGNIHLTRTLTNVEEPASVHTSPFLDNPLYEPMEETPQLRTQQDTSFILHLSGSPLKENESHLTYDPHEYTTHNQINLERILDWPLTHGAISRTGSGVDFLAMHSLPALCIDMTSCSEVSDHAFPTQTYFAKGSMPQSLLLPDKNKAFSSTLTVTDSKSQEHWSAWAINKTTKASLNIHVPQSHSITTTVSPVTFFQQAPSGEYLRESYFSSVTI